MIPSDAQARLAAYHERIRRRGVNLPLYWLTRAVVQPALHIYFRLRRVGRQHVPARGAVILASNHRSFLDPFVLGCCVRRPVYFFAKEELFERRLTAWFLNAVGAFPVRRGGSDEEAMITARAVLLRGDPLVMFPEGTRIRSGSLGAPRRGVGRLALETGAPVVPVAIVGTDRVRRGWRIRPYRVRSRCGGPLTFPRVAMPSPRLASEVVARIWPCVEIQWEWLGGLPPLRKAAVVGAGPMGTALAALLSRAGLEVQLGCRTAGQAEEIAASGENARHLPGAAVPAGVHPRPVADIEFAGVDLVAFAVPAKSLQAAVAQVGDRIAERAAVLVASKGLIPPLGAGPTRYVGERVRARAVAFLGGPAHAAEAIEGGASLVLATRDDDLSRQLVDVLTAAGLDVEATDDVVGTELAACAKNAAALAAAAAASGGMNAAGAAAARVFAEVRSLAVRHGARDETFIGLAGTGDLVATVMAAGSRNRRAGDLLGQGVRGAEIPSVLGCVAEALDAVPLLADALEAAGLEARATQDLGALIEGRLGPADYVASVRPAARAAARRAA